MSVIYGYGVIRGINLSLRQPLTGPTLSCIKTPKASHGGKGGKTGDDGEKPASWGDVCSSFQHRQALLSDRIFEKRGLDTKSNMKNGDSVKENVSCNKFLMAYYAQGADRLWELMMGTTGRVLKRAGNPNRRQSGTQGDAPLIGATQGTRGRA